MTNVVQLQNKHDWKWHRDHIKEAWGKDQVEAIIEVGRRLNAAKHELPHGSYGAMVQTELPFGRIMAHRYRNIANHEIISNVSHVKYLPPSCATLYELTRIPTDILLAKIKDGTINPKLQRKDVAAMKPNAAAKPSAATDEELVAAIRAEPNANQRDAAAALGVSLGMYQRTRRVLLAPLTVNELRERIVALLLKLPKDERRQEISRIMNAADMNIRDWVSSMTIGRKGK